jgi:hypothetical protein
MQVSQIYSQRHVLHDIMWSYTVLPSVLKSLWFCGFTKYAYITKKKKQEGLDRTVLYKHSKRKDIGLLYTRLLM